MGNCCTTHGNEQEDERIFTDDIEFMMNNSMLKQRFKRNKYISTQPILLTGIMYDSNGIWTHECEHIRTWVWPLRPLGHTVCFCGGVPTARLELATSGLEVLRAIQLRHAGFVFVFVFVVVCVCVCFALSGGVEPPTLWLTATRSDQLSYKSRYWCLGDLGDYGHRSHYFSHAKRALYHLS